MTLQTRRQAEFAALGDGDGVYGNAMRLTLHGLLSHYIQILALHLLETAQKNDDNTITSITFIHH
jgi:hypothetical protein